MQRDPASHAKHNGWTADIPTLLLLVDQDSIVDETDCLDLAERMSDRGKDVQVHLIRETTHGFDQAEKSFLSTLAFSPEALSEAQGVAASFLGRVQ